MRVQIPPGVPKHLGVAQLEAREFRELQVAGSIPATQTFLAPVAQSEEVPRLERGGYWFKPSQGYWCDAGEVARVGLEVS